MINSNYSLQDWIDIVHANRDVTFQCFHHHLSFMMEKMLKRKQRVEFNQYLNKDQVYDFLEQHYNVIPDRSKNGAPIVCQYDESKFRERLKEHDIETKRIEYNSGNNKGKFFESRLQKDEESDSDDGLNFMDSNIFNT